MFIHANLKNSGGIALAIIAMLLGAMLIFIPYESLIGFLFTLIGIIIVITNLIPCYIYWVQYKANKNYLFEALSATISLLLGFIFIFCHGIIRDVISIILAIWLVVLPIVRIVKSDNKNYQLKKEIPYILIGILLFFVPASSIFSIIIKVFGGIIFIYGIILLILTIKNNSNNNDNNSQNSSKDDSRIIIDVEYKDVE